MKVPFIKKTLGNGLDVIVHEDHRVPLVAVSVWYHVGSKNERPGHTGFAHLFEHLMFEGSEHQPRGFFEPLQAAGASLNGSTSTDRTDYWEVVPREAARLALWMEADRMGWLLPALTPERFETQRGVVLNERRQSYENRPYGLAQFALLDAVYPPDHPYHWPTIGKTADLHATSIDEVRAFFSRYYHPANASLVVAGDIGAGEAFGMVEELFGEIPPGPAVGPVASPSIAARACRLRLEDRVEMPRLYMAWPSPALFEPGDADLDLAADLVGNGRTARLYRRLIHDRRVASEVAAAQSSRELDGMFQVLATVAPGHTLSDLHTALCEEIADLAAHGPTVGELERGRAQAESSFVYRVQALGGFGGKADHLNAYNTYRRSPDFFDEDLSRYLDASLDSVRSAVAGWLDPARAVALSVVPRGREDLALPDSSPVPEDL